MKIVFFGTPEIAVPALKALIESRHEVVGVVTQPDRPSGRGMTTKYSPVKQAALEADIPVLQPASIKNRDEEDAIRALNADLFVVIAFSQLLPKWFLEIAPYGCINIHPSMLPKYRGAAPLRGAILNGDTTFGVTIMKMAEKLDAGDILLQKEFPMEKKETVVTLTPKAAKIGAEMLLEVVDSIEAGTAKATPQDEAQQSYIKQLDKEDGRIRFEKSAECIERQIRGCTPWPSAFTKLSGKTFKIWDADVVDAPEGVECTGVPGTVIYADKRTVLVECSGSCLSLKEVQMEGKKRMGIEEFLRGKKLEKGFVFGE